MKPELSELRQRVMQSLQRALVGEIKPALQAVAAEVSAASIIIIAYVDVGTSTEVLDDFDASVVTQVVADFCWPERGDPVVSLERIELAVGDPIPHRADQLFVFARASGIRR